MKSLPRYLLIVFALAGDSTMTRDLPIALHNSRGVAAGAHANLKDTPSRGQSPALPMIRMAEKCAYPTPALHNTPVEAHTTWHLPANFIIYTTCPPALNARQG